MSALWKRATTARVSALAAGLVSVAACGGALPHSREAGAVQPLTVRVVDWDPTHTAIAAPEAVADNGDAVAIFGDKGSWTFRSGALSSHADGAWSSAATVTGADGSPRWIVGVDSKGKLLHLRGSGGFEDVTSRYGLPVGRVRSASMVDGQRVAFLVGGKIAVADGEKVTRYGDAAITELAGGGGYAAGVGKDDVLLFHVTDGTLRHFELAGALHVALGPDGHLYASTGRALYAANAAGDGLDLLYVAPAEQLHGLVAAGDRVWFADGSELGSVRGDGGGVLETSGAKIAADARLFGSASGDVWVVERTAVKRFASSDPRGASAPNPAMPVTPANAASSENVAWTGKLEPVFARACAGCHQPDGSAGVDLSSFAAWNQRRADIYQQVVVQKSMPPYGAPLGDADRATITAWVGTPATATGSATSK